MVGNKLLVTDTEQSWLILIGSQEATNRERFLLNHPEEFRVLDYLVRSVHRVGIPLGLEKDQQGRSHGCLLPFMAMLVRHSTVAAQRFMACESFSAWPTFRPGLEAFLFLGKLADDPANFEVWRDRRASKQASNAYTRTFAGDNVISTSLPRSKAFHRVLKNINDHLMHPNPEFFARDFGVQQKGSELVTTVNHFDASVEEVEAHLLAFLHLLDLIRLSSLELVSKLLGLPDSGANTAPWIGSYRGGRAAELAAQHPTWRTVLVDLGLWDF